MYFVISLETLIKRSQKYDASKVDFNEKQNIVRRVADLVMLFFVIFDE